MPGPRVQDYKFIFHRFGGNDVYFEASNEDTTESDYQYFGYISSFGSWIIQRFYVVGSTYQYAYAAGKERIDYDTHWNTTTGRFIVGDLTFTTFDLIGDNP